MQVNKRQQSVFLVLTEQQVQLAQIKQFIHRASTDSLTVNQ